MRTAIITREAHVTTPFELGQVVEYAGMDDGDPVFIGEVRRPAPVRRPDLSGGRTRMTYYNRDGTPCEIGESEFGPGHNRSVARDTVNGIMVSTVFLVIDHGHGEGRPVLFETMTFGGEHDGECVRYRTEREAMAGHVEVVYRVEQGLDPFTPTIKGTA